MYGSGGNPSFVIQKLIVQHFCVFQTINLWNFSVTWNKIHNSSNHLISYPSITKTQIKHMLPTNFKFRVNPYIKTILSKTQENSKLKTRYLKGITRVTIHHFHFKRLSSESSLFYSALKNKLKQTRYIFLFCFHLQITHYYYK